LTSFPDLLSLLLSKLNAAMSLARKKDRISLEAYFELQRSGPKRHDFWDGELVELEATTKNHNRIKRNIIDAIPRSARQAADCELFDENVMTQLKHNQNYVYPDIVLTCDPRENDPLVIEYPCMLIEILSDGTERYDRTDKFFQYQRIPTVEQCVFIAQNQMAIESFQRADHGQWLMQPLQEAEDELYFPKLDLSIALDAIYDGIILNQT
jgi:Uma2 family endonuclease